MRSTYNYTLLILGMAFWFSPSVAQVKPKTTTQKPAAKPAAKTTAKTPATKTAAQKLGDAAAKSAKADTTKKGGQAAQKPVNNGSLSEEIVVTTNYRPVLADAVKLRRNPSLEDATPYKAPLSYKAIDKRLERNTDIRQMEAMKMPAVQDSDLLNNYAKVGIGSMKTTYGELYINNGRDQALQTGLYLKHFAQAGSDYYKQNQNTEEVAVFGRLNGETNTIRGKLTYDYRGNNFYGYNQFAPPATLNVAKQHFSTIGAEGELTKNFKDVEQDFTYAAKINGYAFSNAFKARESSIVVSGFINQTVKQFYAGLGASLDFTNQKDSTYSFTNNIARINPYLKFQGPNYKIDAGVNITQEFGFNSRFSIFPAARLEFQVIPKYVRLFAEAKGDVNKSSLRNFFQLNPFLGENINIKNSVDQLDVAVGLKGTLAPGLGFKATVFRNEVKNMALMVNNFNFAQGYNRFNVIYDGGRARISGFNGELDFKASEDLNIFGRAEIKDYKMDTEAEAWNLPKLLITAGTAIHISHKVNLNASLVIRGDTYDRIADATTPSGFQKVTVKGFADVNAGIEYRLAKRISIFGQVNNLLNTRYQTWLYYPNYGFNIFGGVSYGF